MARSDFGVGEKLSLGCGDPICGRAGLRMASHHTNVSIPPDAARAAEITHQGSPVCHIRSRLNISWIPEATNELYVEKHECRESPADGNTCLKAKHVSMGAWPGTAYGRKGDKKIDQGSKEFLLGAKVLTWGFSLNLIYDKLT